MSAHLLSKSVSPVIIIHTIEQELQASLKFNAMRLKLHFEKCLHSQVNEEEARAMKTLYVSMLTFINVLRT